MEKVKKDQINCYSVFIQDEKVALNNSGILVERKSDDMFYIGLGNSIVGNSKKCCLPANVSDHIKDGKIYKARLLEAESRWMKGIYILKNTKVISHYIIKITIDSNDVKNKKEFSVLRRVKDEIVEQGITECMHVYTDGYVDGVSAFRQELILVLSKKEHLLIGPSSSNEMYKRIDSKIVYVEKHDLVCEDYTDFVIRKQMYY